MTIFTLDISLRNQPDFRLLMEIESDQDLFCLHLFILKSVGLEEGEMASFYKNYETMNDRIEVCLCDLQKNDRNFLMTDLQINNLLNNQADTIIYIYDFLRMHTFYIELMAVSAPEKSAVYPRILEQSGEIAEDDSFLDFELDSFIDEDSDLLSDQDDIAFFFNEQPGAKDAFDEDLGEFSDGDDDFHPDEDSDFRYDDEDDRY